MRRGGRGLAGWAAVAARVGLVGLERVLLKASGRGRPPDETAFWFFALASVWLAPFALAAAWRPVDWGFLRLALPSGIVYAVAFQLYTASLSAGEVSQVAPLGSANALFVVLLAALVHGEGLGAAKLAGTCLIVGGAVALEGGRPARMWRSRPARQMLGYAFLLGVTRMLDKGAASQVAPGLYAWVLFVSIASVQGCALAWRGGLAEAARAARRRPGATLGASVCNAFSYLLLVASLGELPVSVAEPLTALSLLVTAALAWLVWREPVRARLLPTLAVIAGSWLLAGGAARAAIGLV